MMTQLDDTYEPKVTRGRHRLSLLARAMPVILLSCGASPAPPVPVAAPPVVPPLREAPAGEVWLTPDRVAALTLVHPRLLGGAAVQARVATDDARAEQAHAAQSGVVRSIEVEAGREVQPGAVLLTIDVDVALARNTDVQYAIAKVIAASHQARRLQELIGELPATDLEAAVAEQAQAAAALVAARHGVRTGTRVVQVLAPRARAVVRVEVQPGQPVIGTDVDPNLPTDLVQLADLDHVVLLADDAPAGITTGTAAIFHIEALPGVVFLGTVSVAQWPPRLRCPLDNLDHRLKPGMTGTMALPSVPTHALGVPRTALLPGAAVLVRGGDAPGGRVRLVKTPVELSASANDALVAVTGLPSEAEVVADVAALP
jgi:hypothetical protein